MQFLAILTAVLGFVSLAAGRRAEVFYDGWMSESPTAKPPQNTMGGTLH